MEREVELLCRHSSPLERESLSGLHSCLSPCSSCGAWEEQSPVRVASRDSQSGLDEIPRARYFSALTEATCVGHSPMSSDILLLNVCLKQECMEAVEGTPCKSGMLLARMQTS